MTPSSCSTAPCPGQTGWGAVERDSKGFILTGADVRPSSHGGSPGPPIEPLETSLPGVFAVSDVRAGSVKGVASAVGESATAVQHVHAYLAAAAAQQGEGARSGSVRKKLAKSVTGALPLLR